MTWTKYEYLLQPVAFPGNVTSDIDFTYGTVIRCDVTVLKILLQVIVI